MANPYCACPIPLTDTLAGVDSDSDDFCWACGRAVNEETG